MPRRYFLARTIELGIIPLILLGCVQRTVEGKTTIYSNKPWAFVLTGSVAATFAVLGWFVRRKRRWKGYLLMAGGVLVLGTTVPGMAMSRTVVGPDQFEWRKGFRHRIIRFEDLTEIVHTIRRLPIGRTMEDIHYFDFLDRSGEVFHVQLEPQSDLFFLDATAEIVMRAREKGVAITEKDLR